MRKTFLLLLILFLFLPASARASVQLTDARSETSALSQGVSPRIVGGNTTNISAYPWQVSLQANPAIYEGSPYKRHICGGSLVASNLVISAAHCFYNSRAGSFYHPNNFSILSGRTRLNDSGGNEQAIATYYYFTSSGVPLYNPRTDAWDVVIIKLQTAVPEKPIKIAGPDEISLWSVGRFAKVSGWGSTYSGGPQSNTLRVAAISVLSNSACDVYPEYSTETQMCAGLRAGGRDACQGDSGGPLVVPAKGGFYRLIGNVSYGTGCAERRYPGVYSRLAGDAIRGAIESTFSSLGFANPYGTGATPPDPVSLKFTEQPRHIFYLKGKRKAKVSFLFSGSGGSRFFCNLRKGRRTVYKSSCSSLYTRTLVRGRYNLRVTLKNWAGMRKTIRHTFRVR